MTKPSDIAWTELQIPGFTLYEPMTAFTDLLLSVLCMVLSFRLSNQNHEQHSGIRHWSACFRYLSVTTGLGAIIHGFIPDRTSAAYLLSWLTMQIISGMAVLNAQLGSIDSGNGMSKNKMLPKLFIIQFTVFTITALLMKSFYAVVANSAVGIACVLYFQFKWYTKGSGSAGLILLGFLISFSVIGVYLTKLSAFPWLNHLDIAHLIMMASLAFIYKGAMRLHSIPGATRKTITN